MVQTTTTSEAPGDLGALLDHSTPLPDVDGDCKRAQTDTTSLGFAKPVCLEITANVNNPLALRHETIAQLEDELVNLE